MANLSQVERQQLEDLFEMGAGNFMDFNHNSLADFFRTTVGINIADEKYQLRSGSKANRMRAFWEKESNALVGKALAELLKLWLYKNKNGEVDDTYKSCLNTVSRLIGKNVSAENPQEEFLGKDFGAVSFEKLPIESTMIPIMVSRYREACYCLKSEHAPLSVIFMCGSILEGMLMGTAFNRANEFTSASSAPKGKDGKIMPLEKWRLGSLIDVACQINILGKDVKEFGSKLRDFRNYIHPYQQMYSRFNPDQDTAKICMQVLHAAVADLSGK